MKKTFPVALFFIAVLLFGGCAKKKAEINIQKQDYPKSIVALSPAAVEILYAIGAESQISAVSDFCDYPEAASAKPVVGGFDGKTLSIEKILSFQPDFVYLTNGMHNFLVEPLTQYNIPYYISNSNSIEQIKNEILEVGKLTGNSKMAAEVVEKMNATLTAVESKENSITVYYEVWNSPYISAGSSSFINDVIACAGGKNIFDDISDAYPIVSEESILARNPQVILIPQSSGLDAEAIKNRSGWDKLDAVKNSAIFIVDDNLYSRPGPRIASCITNLSKILNNL